MHVQVTGKTGGKAASGSAAASVMFSDTAPSWDALAEMLAAKQLELGIDAKPDLANVCIARHSQLNSNALSLTWCCSLIVPIMLMDTCSH